MEDFKLFTGLNSVIFLGVLALLKSQIFEILAMLGTFKYSISVDSKFNRDIFSSVESWCDEKLKTKFKRINLKMDDERKISIGVALGTFYIKYEGHWLILSRSIESQSSSDPYLKISLSYYSFSSKILLKLIEDIQKVKFKNVLVYSSGIYSSWNSISQPNRGKDTYVDNHDYLKFIQDKIDIFFQKKNEINNRLGFLLEGRPGTGKTSIVHVVASIYGLPIFVLEAKDSESFKEKYSQIPQYSIVLIEDIDSSNISLDREFNKDKINLSTILNCLDGLTSINNTILFITSNKTKELDQALIRKGRIDYTLNFN